MASDNQKKIQELDEQIKKFETQRRWPDVIRTTLAKVELTDVVEEKIQWLLQAGQWYLEKSANQAEAIKSFEAVLNLDPVNDVAITRLKDLYERRRDWEKFVRIREREISLITGEAQAGAWTELARLATERVRKPELCIELWRHVIATDSQNEEACSQLAALYERARMWPELAEVLEHLAKRGGTAAQMIANLQKLGLLYADRLNDDAGAVRAFQRILELDPNERRAQEQLKRRYVTLGMWDELEAFYGSSGRWDELIRTLEREVENPSLENQKKADILERVAHLWLTKKERKDRALKAYEQVIELDPNNLVAATVLAPVYEGQGAFDRLVRMLEVQRAHDAEELTEKRVALRLHLGEVYEKLGDSQTAFNLFMEAFEEDPKNAVLHASLERLAQATQQWDALLEAYQKKIGEFISSEEQTAFRVRVGRVLAELGRTEEAIKQYQTAIEYDPVSVDAWTALEHLYVQGGKYRELVDVYDQLLSLDIQSEKRKEVAYARASVLHAGLSKTDEAIQAYRDIIAEHGERESAAYDAMEMIFVQAGDFRSLADMLLDRVGAIGLDSAVQNDIKNRLAKVYVEHLGEADRALELYREVLASSPENQEAEQGLQTFVDNENESGALAFVASVLLQPIYEVRGEWGKLARVLEAQAKQGQDVPSQIQSWLDAARVAWTRLSDFDRAFSDYSNALVLDAGNSSAIQMIEQLCVAQQRGDALVNLFESLASRATVPQPACDLWIRMGGWYDTLMNQLAEAAQAYQKALDIDAHNLSAVRRLADIYRRTEDHAAYVRVLRREAELVEDAEEAERVLLTVAHVQEAALNSPESAVQVYQEILERNGRQPEALAELDRLYERLERWSDLNDHLQRRIALTEGEPTQRRHLLRMANVRARHLNDPQSAVDSYAQILENFPADAEALVALEQMLEIPEVQSVVADVLEPVYRGQGDYPKLIRVYEVRAANAPPEDRVQFLKKVAELYEVGLDSPEQAFASMATALGEDASNSALYDELERLCAVTGRWDALVHIFEQYAESASEPTVAAALLFRAGRVTAQHLRDVDKAVSIYRKSAKTDPKAMDAVEALEHIFESTDRYEDLARVYLMKAERLESIDEARGYMLRAASIYEEALGQRESAIEVYLGLLSRDPDSLRAIDRLIEHYIALERWDDALEVYKKKAEALSDPEERKRLLVEVGAVYEREKNDIPNAIDAYKRILEVDPTDRVALSRLDHLYQQTEKWQDLRTIIDRQADLVTDLDELIGLKHRSAELLERRLGQPEAAVELYAEILTQAPRHMPTQVALERMVATGQSASAAASVLAPVLRDQHSWQELVSLRKNEISFESQDERKIELLEEVADIEEFQLGRMREALDAYREAWLLDPTREHLMASMDRMAAALHAWPEVAGLYNAQVQVFKERKSEQRLVMVALHAAQIFESELEDTERSIQLYKTVLDVEPEHPIALAMLDRMFEALGRNEELIEVLKQEALTAPSPEEILRFQYRLGRLYEQENALEQAVGAYKEILSSAPEHQDALTALERLFQRGVDPAQIGEILEPIYRGQESWSRLLAVYEVQLDVLKDVEAKIDLLDRMARVAEERLANNDLAFLWMQRALLEDPSNDRVQMELARMADRVDGWNDLAHALADALERHTERAVRVNLGLWLARIYKDPLGDTERADATYRFVLGADPQNEDALEALIEIYTRELRFGELADAYRKRIATSSDSQTLIETTYQLGVTYECQLSDLTRAEQTYASIVSKLDAEHIPAIRGMERVYVRQERWGEVLDVLEKEFQATAGEVAQSEVLGKMAWVASEKLDDTDRAVGYWRRVLDVRGEDAEALNALGDLLARQENWRDVVDILEREVTAVDENEKKIAILYDLGRVWREKIGRDKNAVESWQRIFEIEPDNVFALRGIAEVHRAHNDMHALVSTLQQMVEVPPSSRLFSNTERAQVWLELAHLYAEVLQQPMDAMEAFRAALELDSNRPDALRSLADVLEKEARWEEAVEALQQLRALQEAHNQAEQLYMTLGKLGDIYGEHLDSPDAAAEAYAYQLRLNPAEAQPFEKLESVYRAHGKWDALIEAYLQRAEQVQDASERIELIRRIARIYEQELDEPEKAFEALQLAWSEDYTDRKTADDLERLARVTQQWNGLLSSANEALAQLQDPELKIAICLNCARWYGQELGHPEYSIPYYEQILSLDPNNVPAIRQIADLYRVTQQWSSLAQTLGRLVEIARDPATQASTYVEMGELAEGQLGVPERAEGYYARALELDNSSIPAMEGLEAIYRSSHQYRPWVDVLKRKIEVLDAQPGRENERDQAALKLGQLLFEHLDQPHEALQYFQKVAEADPSSLAALKGLATLQTRLQKWPELRESLERQLDLDLTDRERVDALMRLATLWEEEFLKPDRAGERLETLLTIDPQNMAAYERLEGIYTKLQKWTDLVDIYERHASQASEKAERVRAFQAAADIYARELSDAERAVEMYRQALVWDPAQVDVLRSLAELSEKRGDDTTAQQAYGDLVEALSQLDEPKALSSAYVKFARLLHTRLGDSRKAIDALEKCLKLQPDSGKAFELLRQIYVDREDWAGAIKTVERHLAMESTPTQRAALFFTLGQLYETQLHDADKAVIYYESSLKEDPGYLDAAMPLIDEYVRRARYADAVPLLQMVTARATEPAEQYRLYDLLGRCASESQQFAVAKKAYTKAHELESDDLGALMGLAVACFYEKDWDAAFKHHQALLVHHREALSQSEIADLFFRLGVIKFEQGDRKKALNMFEKALESDRDHRPTLLRLVELYESEKSFEQVVHYKRQLLSTADDAERAKILEEVGDIWSQKFSNSQKAVEAFEDILDFQPSNLGILHKLLALYQSTKQWEKTIETIDKVSDLDDRSDVKAKYAYTVGVIYRDELKDHDAALLRFTAALDADPMQLKAFEAINKILTARKDWKQLEREFRKMLHRVTGKGDRTLEVNLWHNLGIIYRDRLQQIDSSAEAFRMAVTLDPNDATRHKILGEIYTVLPNKIEDALAEYQWLVASEPTQLEHYHQLFKLCFDARMYDRAWCVAATLTFLRGATPEQKQFFEQYRTRGMIRPQSRLDPQKWATLLLHPDEDLYVGKIFEAITPAILDLKKLSDKQCGLAKKYEVDPQTSTAAFAKAFAFSAQVLNVSMPRLFLRTDVQGGLAYAITVPPASVAGSSLLSGVAPQDVAFMTAKHLTYYRGEHYLRRILPSASELKTALVAAMRVVGLGPSDPMVDSTAKDIAARLQPVQREALTTLAKRFMEAGARADIKVWMHAVELTACRAGFLVCNDLEIATRMVQSEQPDGPADLPVKDKVADLLAFSVSARYFALREALGIQIRIG